MNRLIKLWPVTPAGRWSCYAGDLSLLVLAGFLALHEDSQVRLWRALLIGVCVLVGAGIGLLPHLNDLRRLRSASVPDPSAEPAVEPVQPDLMLGGAQSGDNAALVEIALLAWRIQKRASRQPDQHPSILRNAGQILELLSKFGVEIVSYAGRKLDLGSRVNVLEWVEGEENRVIEEHEPQIQLRGRVVHQALVTAGRSGTG